VGAPTALTPTVDDPGQPDELSKPGDPGTSAQPAGSHTIPALSGSAFSVGWLMADLYDRAKLPKSDQNDNREAKLPDSLPTLAGLGDVVRRDLDRRQLLTLLPAIVPSFPATTSDEAEPDATTSSAVSSDAVTKLADDAGATKDLVLALNEQILRALALSDPGKLAGYQLGRALRDTCWLPDKARGGAFFLGQFNRDRLAVLQGWLGQVSSTLPGQSAGVVSRSLNSWQTWAEVSAPALQSSWDATYSPVVAALRQQSHVWHGLLSGEIDVPQTPSTDAWMFAGDSVLRTISHFTWRVVRRFYVLVALLILVAAAVIVLGVVDANGLSKLWTAIAAVAGFVGISGAGLRAGARKATGTLETSLREAAELDAKAWETTWLPPVKVGLARLRLGSRGVTPPRSGVSLPPNSTGQAPASR